MKKYTLSPVVILALGMSVWAQTIDKPAQSNPTPIHITGLLLASDWRCQVSQVKENQPQVVCPPGAVGWKLFAGAERYSLRSDAANLKQYERSRVTITGEITGKEIAVDAVVAAEVKEEGIRALVEQLRSFHWEGPRGYSNSNPIHWMFNFTTPMLQILQAGTAAQDTLLNYIGDKEIKDQIIILLGGVGDERALEPIIQAMADSNDRSTAGARVNLMANLALTNITQGEVIWHHGGGITIDRCPDDPKSCWYAWWIHNRDTFKVSTETGNRNYSNYPNYGIYQQP